MLDILYPYTMNAPLDLTVQVCESGDCVNLGKRMDVVVGSKVFWFYGDHCLGFAHILWVVNREKNTLTIWCGRREVLTDVDRSRVYAAYARHNKNIRGGAYV